MMDLLSGGIPSSRNLTDADRALMDDIKLSPDQLSSSIFTGSEEIFAFRRVISRLNEMQSEEWIGNEIKTILDHLN